MKRVIFALMVLAVPVMGGACESMERARLDLKKWGLSYCLGSSLPKDNALQRQAAIASGGYFQKGAHDDEAAYESVRRFFKAGMKNLPVGKHDGKPLPYMKCLDLYESQQFERVIREQDKFLPD